MEPKSQSDVHLKAILNNPISAKQLTPAVPVPDWNAVPVPDWNAAPEIASTSANTIQPSQVPVIKSNPSLITVTIPGSAIGEPHTNITLQNCVSTVDLNTTLDLENINARTRNSEYNPARFHGVIMRLREPRTTALIFRSGKIVCTGARNEYDGLLASKKFARIVQKLGFNIKFSNFKIQNLVATCDLRFPIKLENLNMMHGQFSSYEPELFPGLVYRMVKPRLVLLIYVNGKIVFTGAKNREDIKEALHNIYPILRSFRKN